MTMSSPHGGIISDSTGGAMGPFRPTSFSSPTPQGRSPIGSSNLSSVRPFGWPESVTRRFWFTYTTPFTRPSLMSRRPRQIGLIGSSNMNISAPGEPAASCGTCPVTTIPRAPSMSIERGSLAPTGSARSASTSMVTTCVRGSGAASPPLGGAAFGASMTADRSAAKSVVMVSGLP